MRKVSTYLIGFFALSTMLVQFSVTEVQAQERLWEDATVLIMKGGTPVKKLVARIHGKTKVDYIECIIHNIAGVPIGTYSTPVEAFDLTSPITIETAGGTLEGTFGSILNPDDRIFQDGTFEVLQDNVLKQGPVGTHPKQYFVFNGTTGVGGDGDWVGTGEFQDVKNIIWRCKFELEVDPETGELVLDPESGSPKVVACLYCLYTLVFDDVPM